MSGEINCGFQHHFICECRFHLATFVGSWLVSTVGDHQDNDVRKPIGAGTREGGGRTFETMVFPTDGISHQDEGHPIVTEWSANDFEGYGDEVAANRGHARMVAKYRRKGERT
jgi:hypothetical protein